MQKAEGVLIFSHSDRDHQVERKTFTCSHCGKIRNFNEETRGWCDHCDALVCNDSTCTEECLPFKRRLDIAESKDRLRRAANG